jgi:hypothetical protein
MVARNIAKFEEGVLNNNNYFQNFYIAYGFASAFLELQNVIKIKEEEMEIRNRMFRNLNKNIFIWALKRSKTVTEAKKTYFDKSERLFRIFQQYIRYDYKLINQFMDIYDKVKLESNEEGDLYRIGTIGIVEYEYPED